MRWSRWFKSHPLHFSWGLHAAFMPSLPCPLLGTDVDASWGLGYHKLVTLVSPQGSAKRRHTYEAALDP